MSEYTLINVDDVEDHYAGSSVPGEFRWLAGALETEQVAVTLIRIAMVAAVFCSGGLVLLAYIVASFIMPVDYGPTVHVPTEARATS